MGERGEGLSAHSPCSLKVPSTLSITSSIPQLVRRGLKISFIITFMTPRFWAILRLNSSLAYAGITLGDCSNKVSSLVHPNSISSLRGCSSPAEQQLSRKV